MESDRFYAIRRRLFDYLESPSLKHIRDPNSVSKLAKDILVQIDQATSVWRKWDGVREDFVRAAATCWIPTEDLRDFLNGLPGPELTTTDLNQRLRSIWEEAYNEYPAEELKARCLELYQREKAASTEMAAIVGALHEFVESERERLRLEREENYRRAREEERARQIALFNAGADTSWIKLRESKDLFCRINGRAFRIAQGKDKRWTLFRIEKAEDGGNQLGVYAGRGDANKALKVIAFQPEPRW